ncbi:hypothetical protein [Mesorhizobium sp. B2-4-6]|uniref:hypothetical protein n=1 Tax=Mesorhizobium sp. B2-4-6 TaxID=2589943 RepID=UPI001129E336|nr:hypothetical protein [Mesorhizobium sp. B2-4-6]TPL49720.1 hypothetical protein FJ957_11670 [Mesorhizobium sp. B2-4-6]
MNDVFGYIAYGDNEVYHFGALLSALKLLHNCSGARIIVATDRPELFRGYPVETIAITAEQKEFMSFGWRYHFGIKAAFLIEILKQADRLIFMDSDHYPYVDPSRGFRQISPIRSFMRKCEGEHRLYPVLTGKGVKIADYTLTGHEPMWQSGILGIHRANVGALTEAYSAMLAVRELTNTDAPEQFCIGVALSRKGLALSRHHLPVSDYNTRGKKAFASPRVLQFFKMYGDAPIAEQIRRAGWYRLWRSPVDLWRQRRRWSF